MNFFRFEIVQQLEHYDNVLKLKERVNKLTQVNKWCYIVHHKDVKEDGTPKAPHFHLYVTLNNTMTGESIAKTMNVPTQYVEKIKGTTRGAFEYAIHKNDPTKAQYDPTEVVANFDYVDYILHNKDVEKHDKCCLRLDILEQIANGEIKEYNIHDYVSVEEYTKFKLQFDRAFEYRIRKLKGEQRKMKTIFISGSSGTGKTTLAETLAVGEGYHYYVADGGKNPMDGYMGQECIILDDLRDSDYKINELLKITDNHKDSNVACRYYNKSILECKLLIITCCKPITSWYDGLKLSNDVEPIEQLYRRFPHLIYLTKSTLQAYKVDDDYKGYHKDGALMCNPVELLYNQEKQINLFSQFKALSDVTEYKNDNVDVPHMEQSKFKEVDQLPW